MSRRDLQIELIPGGRRKNEYRLKRIEFGNWKISFNVWSMARVHELNMLCARLSTNHRSMHGVYMVYIVYNPVPHFLFT